MNTLKQKIASISEKPGSGARAKTVVSLDASNIALWARSRSGQYEYVRFPGDSDIPAPSNDIDAARVQVVSMVKLADDLAANDDVSSVKYYTPEVTLNYVVIESLYSWLTANGHANHTLAVKTPGSKAFLKEMERVYRDLVGKGSIEEFFGKHAPMVRALFRFRQNKVMARPFQAIKKAEVVTRLIDDVSGSILVNPDHRFQAKAILSFLKGASGFGMDAERLDFNLQTHDFTNLKKAADEAAAALERMRQNHPEVDWEDVPAAMQKIRNKLGQIIDFVDAYNEKAKLLTGILRDQSALIDAASEAVTGPSGYMRSDLDTAIVAKSMSPEVLKEYDQQVVFSGDGDFVPLYRGLMEAGKKVIVVSPVRNLSSAVRSMVCKSLEVHDPHFDDIWMER